MTVVRRLKGRNAHGIVEVHGEVLFAPGAVLDRWKRKFSTAVTTATIAAAPSNERPRWKHYGKPLKGTITSSTDTDIVKGGGKFHIAVGSTAPYAYFVDQGTGMHVGNAEWAAEILPPRTWGGGDLYERRPFGRTRKEDVYISGQRPQYFFDAGLARGFHAMRLRSVEIPGEGVSGLASGLQSFPLGLADEVSGATPSDAAFRAQLGEWRAWRKAAWEREAQARRDTRARQRATKPVKPKRTKPSMSQKTRKLLKADRAKFLAAMLKKYGASNVDTGSLELKGNRWNILIRVKGENGRYQWVVRSAQSKVL